jgi:hypothetical protein
VVLLTCRYSRSPPCWYRLHSVGGMWGTICQHKSTKTHVNTAQQVQPLTLMAAATALRLHGLAALLLPKPAHVV